MVHIDDEEFDIIAGETKEVGKVKFVWWGISQWYKWRKHETHIDLGVLSLYNLPKWVVEVMGFWIQPLRIMYHEFFVNKNFKGDKK